MRTISTVIYTPTHNVRRAVLWSFQDQGANQSPFRHIRRVGDSIDVLYSEGIAIVGPAIGAPAAALIAEDLSRRGMRSLFLIGSAGGLLSEMNIGDIVLPRRLLTEDTTSALYGEPKNLLLSSAGLQGELEHSLKLRLHHVDSPPKTHEGGVWTTDAPLLETPFRQKLFLDQGAISVEMELAILSLLSHRLGFNLAAGFALSDLPGRRGFKSPAFKYSLGLLADAVTSAIIRSRQKYEAANPAEKHEH